MADNDDYESGLDLEAFLSPDTKGEFEDPRLALARACLARSMSARQVAAIRAAPFGVVVIEVASSWETWIGKALLDLFPGRHLFVPTPTRKGKSDSDAKRLMAAIAQRKGILAVLPDGEGFPKPMHHLPDKRIAIKSPNVPVLREVARRCLVGNSRRIKSVPAGTDLDALAACFSPGASVASAVARLERMMKPSTPTAETIPPLSSVLGVDAARAWGMDLKADIAAFRAGKLPFSSVDAGAVLAGLPGTGKTMVARIIAAECKLAFVATSIGELFATSDGDLGAVIKRSRQIFSQALEAAPSLLFIDELDALPGRSSLGPSLAAGLDPVRDGGAIHVPAEIPGGDGDFTSDGRPSRVRKQ